MRSSLMSRSLFLCLTSVAALASGCSDDSCGPGDAPKVGLVAGSAEVTLTFGNMTSRAGNDCPDPSAPVGVVSVSIEGAQTDGTGGLITLCVPRPDLLMQGNRTLGLTISSADIRIIDLHGSSGACTYAIDSTRPPTGTGSGSGVCNNGIDKAGFAIELDGAVSLRRTCGAMIDTVAVKLTGSVAVPAE